MQMERDVFTKLNHPNIIKLICTFQDQNALYFALELAAGGELYTKYAISACGGRMPCPCNVDATGP
jgi:serine/threonine protein kinase